MKVFEMHAEGVMCQSPYGDVGAAGTKVVTDDYYGDEEGF